VIDLAPLMRLAILLVRPGMLVGLSPAFGGDTAPARLKVGFIMLVAIALAPSVVIPPAVDALPIALVVAREAAIGFALALAIRVLVAGAAFGGHLAGYQMGLSYGATIDPQSGVRNPILAVLYTNIALMTFFAIDGHHAFLRALHQSYTDLPVGVGGVGRSLPEDVARMLGTVFTLGARLAAPVVLVLLIVETALALLSRSAPLLNAMGIGAPARLIVGLLVLAVVVPTVAALVAGTSTSIVQLAARVAGAFR